MLADNFQRVRKRYCVQSTLLEDTGVVGVYVSDLFYPVVQYDVPQTCALEESTLLYDFQMGRGYEGRYFRATEGPFADMLQLRVIREHYLF